MSLRRTHKRSKSLLLIFTIQKRGMNMTNALKDVYNEEFIFQLAKTVHQFYERFDVDAFINLVFSENWTEKTLKGRMRHVTICLNAFLPPKYEDAIIILRKVARIVKRKFSFWLGSNLSPQTISFVSNGSITIFTRFIIFTYI